MWWKRKRKNRRLGREFVLDVKLRSSQVRAARTRMAAVALAIVFAAVLGGYLLWATGGWALDRLVYENRAFAIEDIDVQTDGVIPLDQLRRWTGVHPGDNLLALDLARVIRDLQLVSLVKSASVERILPHTLRVRVTEREPVAQISLFRPRAGGGVEASTFQVDEEGYVMIPLPPAGRPPPPGQAGEQLPVLAVVNAAEVQAGHRLESAQIQAALRLLVAFEHSPMASYVDFKRIDVSNPEVLTVTTSQGSELTFGLTNLDQQLRRWREIYELGQKIGKAIATLDLAVTNYLPATWLDASAVTPGTPKRPKSIRKKHV